jgi:GNAT superfamily N-acetyltransferase
MKFDLKSSEMNFKIRKINEADFAQVSQIIRRNLREVNFADYDQNHIEELAGHFSPEQIGIYSSRRHIVVAILNDKLIGTASTAINLDTNNGEYIALTVFVNPDYHNIGVGTALMDYIETHALEMGSKKIHVPASYTAVKFYQKRGYVFTPEFKKDTDTFTRMAKVLSNERNIVTTQELRSQGDRSQESEFRSQNKNQSITIHKL